MTLCWVRPVCQALDLYSLGLSSFLPEDGTPPPTKAQLFPGLQAIACLDRAVTETQHKMLPAHLYLFCCAETGGLAVGREMWARWKLQNGYCYFWNSLFKAPRQIIVTGPDPRTVPLTMMPEMQQNTVKQWGKKIESLYRKHQRPDFNQLCKYRHIHEQTHTGNLHVWLKKEDLPHVVIYRVCALGEIQATGCWDCKKFSVWSAPRYHHCLLFSSKPSAWSVLLTVSVSSSSHSPSLSFCFSSAEAAASVVQMVEFTPNQKDFQRDYLNWVPPGRQMLQSTSELSINQQNLNCSENGQQQDNALKSISTHSQPKNTSGKLQVFFLLCKQRNKGQKHSLPRHLDGFFFQISLDQRVYVSHAALKRSLSKIL